MSVNFIPDGFHTITPYLQVIGARGLIEFLKQAFVAEEIYCHEDPSGVIAHAEFKIGTSRLMIAEARGEHPPIPASMYLYVENTDAVYERALKAGASSIMEPADQFYGDRNAGVKDACGNQWWIATHIEDVSAEEVTKRMQAMRAPSSA